MKGVRTVEERIGNETTRIDRFATNGSDRFAVSTVEIAHANEVAFKLILINALDITTVILEEIRQLVVEQHGVIKVVWDVELHDALSSLGHGDGVVARAVDEHECWRVDRDVGVTCAEAVVEVRHIRESIAGV